MGQLTEGKLKKLIREAAPVAGVSDGDGLTYTMSRAQAERAQGTWVFRYRHAQRQREMTLGNYPDMTLERARESARAARVMVDLGKDVAGEKRRAKAEAAAARTFRELAEDYLAGKKKIADRTKGEWRRYLEKDIYPSIGHVAMADVTVDEVRTTVKRIANRSQTVARRAFEMISVIFAHAVADGAALASPCRDLKASALVGEAAAPRERKKLSREQLRAVLSALPRLGPVHALVVKILLATCVRKNELIRAKRVHVDLAAGLWTVPAENAKTGKGYVIPLAPAVVRWFAELFAISRSSEWVLPKLSRRVSGRDEHMCDKTLNNALERLNLDISFSPHDLRSTARSHLAELGVDVIVAERCLNHSLGGLVAVYDQHDYLDERRKALAKWAQVLAELEWRPDNIVPLRAAA